MTRKPWHQMNKLILAAILILASVLSVLVPSTVRADGTSYYVDSAGGSDSNTGSSETQAWKTLDKVNATVFQPGDRILFKAGGVWTGTLSPQGSGSEGSPIQIDRYSEGAKPLIAGEGPPLPYIFTIRSSGRSAISRLPIMQPVRASAEAFMSAAAAEAGPIPRSISISCSRISTSIRSKGRRPPIMCIMAESSSGVRTGICMCRMWSSRITTSIRSTV